MKRALAAAWLLLLLALALAPGLAARAIDEPRAPTILAAPAPSAWLGTDDRGRSIAWRLAAGARPLVVIAATAAAIYVAIGALFGVAAALWRPARWLADRTVEVALVVPVLHGLLAWRALLGAPGAVALGVALGLVYGPHAARLCRAETERVLAMPYTEASRAVGVPAVRLFFRHVAPEALRPALVLALLALGQAALFEGALGAIGLGLAPPTATWGELLQQAVAQPRAWWLWLAPTTAIALSVLATNALVGKSR